MKKFLLYVSIILLLTAGMAAAADEKILDFGADYRFRMDTIEGTVPDHMRMSPSGPLAVGTYKVKNDILMTDRIGLNVKANVAEDLTVVSRLIMHKVWGQQTMQGYQGPYFADRAYGPFDGTVARVPSDSHLRVDRAYAAWKNIGGSPVWLSAGRRPTTEGVPSNLKQMKDRPGAEGVPGIMVDYAFDGATLGIMPAGDGLNGAYAKLTYGKGFDSGYTSPAVNTLKDTDFIGLNIVPYDTDALHIDLQVHQGLHLADRPADFAPIPNNNQQPVDPNNPPIAPSDNVGDITWVGGVVMGKVGALNLFASAAQSRTDPNDHTVGGAGLLWDANNPKARRTGTAVYVGGRYDIESIGTRIGLEYNQGSKYWVGLVPAADDVWTGKLGTRGKVYDIYITKALSNRPLMKSARTFWTFGYQLYQFDHTGSNNWMGAPVKISELDLTTAANAQSLTPIKEAQDLYVIWEVLF